MNPALPRTYNLLRYALGAAIAVALTALFLFVVWYFVTGRWAAPYYDVLDTLQEWQYTISNLLPFPWE